MACADDPQALSDEVVAARAADLCQAAESVANSVSAPYYIIGTEVPVPGGAHEDLQELAVTRVEDLARTIDIHRRVFEARGLEGAWDRVIGVVVQPGVEFDHARVIDYQPEKAKALSEAILRARLIPPNWPSRWLLPYGYGSGFDRFDHEQARRDPQFGLRVRIKYSLRRMRIDWRRNGTAAKSP